MTLHTIGPSGMAEDERVIGKGYQTWLMGVYAFGPVIAAQYLPTREVAFICAGVALANIHEIGGRLHDICIRIRRTNILLQAQVANRASNSLPLE